MYINAPNGRYTERVSVYLESIPDLSFVGQKDEGVPKKKKKIVSFGAKLQRLEEEEKGEDRAGSGRIADNLFDKNNNDIQCVPDVVDDI